jgi:alpha-tubulin suppressor-like RCC1 family protein
MKNAKTLSIFTIALCVASLMVLLLGPLSPRVQAGTHAVVLYPNGGSYYLTNQPLDLANAVAIAGDNGDGVGLALQGDGTLIGLVLDTNGVLFTAPVSQYGPTNFPLDLTNVFAIASGRSHRLALKGDGTVAGWGDDDFGQINVPAGLTNVVAIAAGEWDSFALKADGTVAAWGGDLSLPGILSNVVAIAGSWDNGLALKDDGTVLFLGSTNAPDYWGWEDLGPSLTNIVAIATGGRQQWARRADDTWVAWGAYLTSDWLPVVLPGNIAVGLTNTVAMFCSINNSFALQSNGTLTFLDFLMAWEYPDLPPVQERFLDLTNVAAVSAGDDFGLALLGDHPPILQSLMANPRLGNDGFSVDVPTDSGKVYRLEYKNSLADTTWTPLPLVAGNGRARTFTDTTKVAVHRFYRLRRW